MRRHPTLRLVVTVVLTLLVCFGLAAAGTILLSGCAATRPAPPEAERPALTTTAAPDTTRTPPGPAASPAPRPAFPLSTAAGSARRQARRDARAATPRRMGKGAVYAPKATEVAAGYKNRAPVVLADSAAVVTVIGKNKAPAATAPNATATQTTARPLIPWYWWLIAVAAAVAWFARKSIPFLG